MSSLTPRTNGRAPPAARRHGLFRSAAEREKERPIHSAPAKRALSPAGGGYLVLFLPAVLGRAQSVKFLKVCFPGGLGTH